MATCYFLAPLLNIVTPDRHCPAKLLQFQTNGFCNSSNHRFLKVRPHLRSSTVPPGRIFRYQDETENKPRSEAAGIQLYGEIEKLMTETAKRSQDGWGVSGDWREVEGAWVLRPRNSRPTSVVHFIGDEAQFKFDRCVRSLQDISDLPTFGIGHSLGSVEASSAVPLFSPVIVPMAQSFGPVISQLISSPTVCFSAEMAMKQFETLSPPIMKQLLNSESAISSLLDMLVRSLPGDHGSPLQQVIPDVPPGMADAVNRGSELLANLTVGTPWETVAREVNSTLGVDIKSQISKDVDLLVDVIASWMTSTMGSMLLKP
ncbi:hypothetical protein IFM89_038408 [Coptis chinensis]|uniref:Uncharacterized protein n=1 Tax=Coptis chinensis TaxID=261450 RepID=A0A835HE92_9MAGN|nr:hypothetical protein IFM89_038408 [Coptis chinensis]